MKTLSLRPLPLLVLCAIASAGCAQSAEKPEVGTPVIGKPLQLKFKASDGRAVVDRVSVHDLHATMLHLLGIDHK